MEEEDEDQIARQEQQQKQHHEEDDKGEERRRLRVELRRPWTSEPMGLGMSHILLEDDDEPRRRSSPILSAVLDQLFERLTTQSNQLESAVAPSSNLTSRCAERSLHWNLKLRLWPSKISSGPPKFNLHRLLPSKQCPIL